MVEMMRWPNGSYSALSMVAGVMPKRAAVSRSITRFDRQPLLLQVAGDVGQLRRVAAAASTSFGTQSLNADRFGFSSTNWYWVRLTVASIVRSCTGCR